MLDPMSSKYTRWSLIFTFIWLMQAHMVNAQTSIGFKVSPTLMINRISNVPDTITIESNGVSFRPVVGLFVDFPIGYQYYFSSGIYYASKPITLNYQKSQGSLIKEKYILQYLQIPLTLKLFTSEVALDKKVYAQVGSVIEIKIHEETKSDMAETIIGFNPAGITLNLGGGMEFRLGTHTFLQAGLSYNRGLANLVETSQVSDDFVIKNDMISIDVGVTF